MITQMIISTCVISITDINMFIIILTTNIAYFLLPMPMPIRTCLCPCHGPGPRPSPCAWPCEALPLKLSPTKCTIRELVCVLVCVLHVHTTHCNHFFALWCAVGLHRAGSLCQHLANSARGAQEQACKDILGHKTRKTISIAAVLKFVLPTCFVVVD